MYINELTMKNEGYLQDIYRLTVRERSTTMIILQHKLVSKKIAQNLVRECSSEYLNIFSTDF